MGQITSNNEEKKTTIQISVATRDLLKSVGRKDETYDELLQRLITFYKEHSKLYLGH